MHTMRSNSQLFAKIWELSIAVQLPINLFCRFFQRF